MGGGRGGRGRLMGRYVGRGGGVREEKGFCDELVFGWGLRNVGRGANANDGYDRLPQSREYGGYIRVLEGGRDAGAPVDDEKDRN